VFVSDVISESKKVLGKCDDEYVYRRISDAVRLANSQGKFDAALGEMDLCVCDGCVTLPAEVATVLAVNSGGYPTLIRDQWFQYHINGTGTPNFIPWGYTNELGQVSTYKDPSGPVYLVAEVENAQDSNKELRVYGWDVNGKRIYTEGAGGVLEDGMLVPTIYGFAVPNPSYPQIARIDKIKKAVTNGFIRLLAVDPTTWESHTQIGYYLPWETAPMYRRIAVPDRNWIRIKYRKKDLEVRSSADWINIENKEALLLLIKAVKFRLDNQLDSGRAYELEGMRLLSNDAEATRPPGPSMPQILFNTYPTSGEDDRLIY